MKDDPRHAPVLADEAMNALALRPGGIYLDGTFGAGGYSARMLAAGVQVIAVDRDPSAIAAGRERFGAEADWIRFLETPFDGIDEALPRIGVHALDGAVFDFGVSSMHLDQPERGFSFMADGPLDMRMGRGMPVSDFVNSASASELADVIYQYGEERRARHLANLIVSGRQDCPFETTGQLARLAERALGKGGKIHPATRLFQALRIFINDELGQIVRVLQACEQFLRQGGHLVAVSFHSLEDRIVKRFFAATSGRASGSRHEPVPDVAPATFATPTKPIEASPAEVQINPRARSARLRVGVRTDAPPSPWTKERLASLGLPPLVISPLQEAWRTSL
ncbi:MAG: 16S rRNA (cytosine(1402)-N(4))-methyltransferase RsmH [Parvularcula sp.]